MENLASVGVASAVDRFIQRASSCISGLVRSVLLPMRILDTDTRV